MSGVLENLRPEPRFCAAGVQGGTGMLAGAPVFVAATDPSRARGAIGVAEAQALGGLLRQAREVRRPVVLLLDSAGARVDEGLPALGAFRRLFREALHTRLASVPMLAVLGRSCYGGASMLACVCSRRMFGQDTRLGTSGPALIEAFEGRERFDATDRARVAELFGAQARQRLLADDEFADGPAQVERIGAWLRANPGTAVWAAAPEHATLRRRLEAAGMLSEPATSSQAMRGAAALLFPSGYRPSFSGSVFWSEPVPGSREAVFAGCVSGETLTARDCWVLADRLPTLSDTHPGSPLVLVLDAASHAASLADEQVLLASFLVHLSLVVAQLAQSDHRAVLWLPGAASGAAYVAFAAPVERVAVLASAQVDILPAAAQQKIIGQTAAAAPDAQALLAAEVADDILDGRLAGYAQARIPGSRVLQ